MASDIIQRVTTWTHVLGSVNALWGSLLLLLTTLSLQRNSYSPFPCKPSSLLTTSTNAAWGRNSAPCNPSISGSYLPLLLCWHLCVAVWPHYTISHCCFALLPIHTPTILPVHCPLYDCMHHITYHVVILSLSASLSAFEWQHLV